MSNKDLREQKKIKKEIKKNDTKILNDSKAQIVGCTTLFNMAIYGAGLAFSSFYLGEPIATALASAATITYVPLMMVTAAGSYCYYQLDQKQNGNLAMQSGTKPKIKEAKITTKEPKKEPDLHAPSSNINPIYVSPTKAKQRLSVTP
jgi:hypothetical protein